MVIYHRQIIQYRPSLSTVSGVYRSDQMCCLSGLDAPIVLGELHSHIFSTDVALAWQCPPGNTLHAGFLSGFWSK